MLNRKIAVTIAAGLIAGPLVLASPASATGKEDRDPCPGQHIPVYNNGNQPNGMYICSTVKGEKGDPGEDGKRGPQGDPGKDGVDGAPGLPGANGLDGAQGPQGEKGDTGEQGPQGEPGADGEQGLPGLPGVNGLDGEQGPAGPAGADGVDGLRGPAGEDGVVGEIGDAVSIPKGEVGEGGAEWYGPEASDKLPDTGAGDVMLLVLAAVGTVGLGGIAYSIGRRRNL